MKKTKKNVAMALLVTMFATLFAGCSSQTGSSTGSTAPSSTAESTASESSSEPESTSAETEGEASIYGALDGMTIKVATSGLYAPYTYYDTDGTTLIGYDIDYLAALQEVLGFELADNELKAMDYSSLVASCSEGKVDMVVAAFCATDERKEKMNFTEPYYHTNFMVLVNKETNPGITGYEDLLSGEYTVCVEKGGSSHVFAQQHLPESCLEIHDTTATEYLSLEEGKVDAMIQLDGGAAYYMATKPETKLQFVGDPIDGGGMDYAIAFSFAFCEEHPEIIELFNQAHEILEENGTMDALKAKWCGAIED